MHFSELLIVQRNHHEKENMKTETFFLSQVRGQT